MSFFERLKADRTAKQNGDMRELHEVHYYQIQRIQLLRKEHRTKRKGRAK